MQLPATDLRVAPRPWVLLCAIVVLSVPLLALGSLSDARLMPGLPLSALMFLCTGAVALWAAWRTSGVAGMRELLRRVADVRRARSWVWPVLTAGVFPAVLLVEGVIMWAFHMPLPPGQFPWLQAPVLFTLFFFSGACEEVAWSATLFEPFQERWGAFGAGLVIGVFVAAWHIIPFAQGNPSVSWVLGQALFTIAFRVVVAWSYNICGRSLFAAIVCHASYNSAWQLFPNHGSGYNPWITAALTWGVVGVVVAISGTRTLTGRHPTWASNRR